MTLYVDITEFLRTRLATGIQRVLKEFLQRVLLEHFQVNIIFFDTDSQKYQLLQNSEISAFLKDIKNYQFHTKKEIDLFQDLQKNKIFFDIDSVWNTAIKRENLYPKLKQNDFKIYNFIYDLTPILLPDFARDNTKVNFPSFIHAVFNHSDLVFFDSASAKEDFFKLKRHQNITRKISSKVIYLGSDFFIQEDSNPIENPYADLLQKKYILFVGTIEPRKNQLQVLKAFEELHKKYADLHLVFIGSVGWKVEEFMHYLSTHPLKDTAIHHLTNVDDATLSLFYQNAFIVTYLSRYEGYGLPIAESLQYANITLTSKNSSMIEVGHNYADYIPDDAQDALLTLMLSYLNNDYIYNQKKQYIKKNYKPHTWNDFYNSIVQALNPNIKASHER